MPPKRHREVVGRVGAHVLVERDGLVGGGDVVVAVVHARRRPRMNTLILPGALTCTHHRPTRRGHASNLPARSSRALDALRHAARVATKSAIAELLAARRRREPGRLEGGGCRGRVAEDRRERLPQHLAALLERRIDEGEGARRSVFVAGLRVVPLERRRAPSRRSGTGQNTCRLTLPAVRQAPYQAAFTLGRAVDLRTGSAATRWPTSACTITTPDRMLGKCSRKCSSTGTETLYGRFATSRVGIAGSSVDGSASWWTP